MKLSKILVPLDGSTLALASPVRLSESTGATLFLTPAAEAPALAVAATTEAQVQASRGARRPADECASGWISTGTLAS
jgi:hypothetical protein